VLEEPARVEGLISVAINEAASCNPNPRAVTLTFTPLERRLGLDALNYSATSTVTFNDNREAFEHAYSLTGLPDGLYDVYWEDALVSDKAPSSQCEVVPRLERGVRIQSSKGKIPQLDLASPPSRPLKVMVLWRDDLQDWRVDVVHPLTGERLSTRAQLTGSRLERMSDGKVVAVANLVLGTVLGEDYVEPKKELLRLSPPEGQNLPTILMDLEGLEVFTPGQVPVTDLKPFEALVLYRAWVWEAEQPDRFVTGSVTFEALQLADVPSGVDAKLTRHEQIGEDGQVEVRLPPGSYQVRVVPDALSGLAAFETNVEVQKPLVSQTAEEETVAGRTQAGHVIWVPRGVEIGGRVELPTDTTASGISVEALSPLRAGLAPVNERTQFIPRTVVALVGKRGGFQLQAADCGRCEPEAGAVFDLRVITPPESALPWWVKPEVLVGAPLHLGAIAVDLPVVYQRRLEFAALLDADERANGRSFPNALIRAYALLDGENRVVNDPNLPTCTTLLKQGLLPEDVSCVRRALQVAETRSLADGLFRLYLPRRLGNSSLTP
jgi:hypothetical protein